MIGLSDSEMKITKLIQNSCQEW